MAVVKVKSYNSSGTKVKSHTREGSSSSKYVGDCSAKGVVKKAIQVTKMSNAKNPIKTGNLAVDFAVGRAPVVKQWNTGFNVGKGAFIAHQTYNETCKKKK